MLQFTGERFIPTKELINDEIGFEHLHRYHCIIPLIQNKTVLDIACGEGYGAALIGKYAQKVYGVDIDESCIQWATEHYSHINNKLDFKKGSVDNIPIPDKTVDVVVSFETIEHVDAPTQLLFLNEVKRVLKQDGILIISTPNTVNYSERDQHLNEFHVKEFHKAEFNDFLKAHFTNIYHFEQGYEIVSTITGENIKDLTRLQVHNWDRTLKEVNRKYLINVASNKEVENADSLSSVVFQVDKDFMDLIDYIKSLQNGITEKDKLITEKDKLIIEKDKLIEEANEIIAEKEKLEHTQLQTIRQISATLVDKENIISELNHKVANLHQQADQLNSTLSEIYSSDGYKLLSVYYRLKGKLLPEHSQRYKAVKKIVNKIRNKKKDFSINNFTSAAKYVIEEPITFDIIEFPVYEQPKVSIIIPAYNGWKMNYKCLQSIFRNTYGTSYEVIFADDVSTDETSNITEYIKNIVVVRNENNLGFLKNCNNAAAFAKGEYIHFLNNDTEVTSGWLSSLVELMDKDPQIGITGSKLIYPDGRLQEAGGIIWQDGSGWNYGHKQNPEASEFNYVKEVDYISGASIMVRKSVWEKLGGFDERYIPAYYEDTDLAFEVRNMGMKVIYQPQSVVIHFEGFSHGKDNENNSGLTSIKSYQEINKQKFIEKWQDVLKEKFPNAVNPFWTRDRSNGKKTIVVIDHYVPHFDKDAGSRLTFQLLKLFVKLNYNVKFFGHNFYKHEPYTSALQQLGIEVLYGSGYHDNWRTWITENKQYFDFFFIQRPHITVHYIDFIKENTKAKIIYFGHDLHFLRELRQFEIDKNPQVLKSAEQWKRIEIELADKADVVLTLNNYEKEVLQEVTNQKNIHILPAFYYDEFKEPITDFTNRKTLFFVGGFNHLPNVDGVLWFAKEVFPLIQKQINDIKFIIAGSKQPAEIMNLASNNIEVIGYISDDDLCKAYHNTKLVVIPLRYGAGVKGKTVEAMHHSIPFVSTSIGIEGLENINELTDGYDIPEEFANRVIELYNNDEKLKAFSREGVKYARKYLSEDKAKELVYEVFS